MTPQLLCLDCRKLGRCRMQWQIERETVFGMADGRTVECSDYLPTWQALLAA